MIVADFASTGRNPFLDDSEIGAVEEAPAFTCHSPGVVFCICCVLDGHHFLEWNFY